MTWYCGGSVNRLISHPVQNQVDNFFDYVRDCQLLKDYVPGVCYICELAPIILSTVAPSNLPTH